ncbi:membrane protein insertase YidC [Prevotella scopos JCM 17725]|uniref:Membrane protein insertase YidC n=1 Tax=Prevotella scopos JCM 17725 TaxID=1236518 RepID=A0AAX2F783_9BACT|nr:membrane protein insertase YidC [Prevotella scopos]ANR74001.1 membrane protein insertase YidC [Prevotella scopos JCM 17725]QUB44592.1 membrane protein insertase YidC [Prevotella scopos JCM 17725]SHG15764.1 YidC/Oxa1 family membrane protein insertase [Prevotella scopos JCM 17725]
MDKRTITGFVLIALILFGFAWWQQPSAEKIAQQRAEFVKDSIAAAKKAQTAKLAAEKQAQQKTAQSADTTALFYAALNGKAQDITLKNNKVELTLNTKGGVVTKAIIKNYVGHDIAVKDGSKDQKDVTLFSGNDQSLNFMLAAKNSNIETKDLIFTPSNVTDSTVTLTAIAGQGKTLTLTYTLGKDYLLNMSLRAEGMNGLFAPNYNQMDINWQDRCRQQERGFTFENRYATLTYKKHDGGTSYLSETSEKEETTEDPVDWIAFKNQFFSAVMIAKDNFATGAKLKSTPLEKASHYLKHYEANMKANFDPTGKRPSEFEFYFGPNDFRLLQSVEKESKFNKELDMERLVYLGWPLFRIINRWFTLYVFDWLSKVFPMGVVLILITLLLKLITFPMVKKSYMSSAKMRVLKPKMEEATKQFNKPEDQMKKQQAMMQKYAEYGVSPLSGCLPMLIQMPIWIAMFNFVPNAIQLRGQSFLWMDDLSTFDPIFSWGHDIWLVGDHISLTCILFCGANLLYTWFTMQQQKDQMVGQQADQMKVMQWMMFGMPLFFFFMFNDYSSGLNFYYFISLFFSAAIMWTLRKTTNEEKLLTILEARRAERKNNPNSNKGGGLFARMQALQEMQQKQQEELRRKQDELNNKKKGL